MTGSSYSSPCCCVIRVAPSEKSEQIEIMPAENLSQNIAPSGTAPATSRPNISRLRTLGPRLLKLATEHIPTLALGFLGLAVASAINLFFPYLIRQVLNGERGLSLKTDLPYLTAVLLGLFLVQAVFFYIRHYCFQMVGYQVVAKIRNLLYGAMLRQDFEFFDRSRLGDLLSRLSADAQTVQRGVTVHISVVLRYAIQVIGGLALMLFISPRLTLLICLVVPLFVFGSAIWGKKLRALSRRMQDELAETNVIAEETIGALRTVRTFAGEAYERLRFERANANVVEIAAKRTKVAALFSSTMVYVLNASIALILSYGGYLVLQGSLSLGDLTAFLLYCALVAVSFGFIVGAWEEFLQAVGAAERIYEIVDLEPRIVSPISPQSLPKGVTHSVEFCDVHFSYATRQEVPVLRGVSFLLPAGKTVALVGPSGSGKTTIASLIPRFYDPVSGSIKISGIDITQLNLQALREDISSVQQNPQVFSISIRENIRYGRLSASDEEVQQACKAANLHPLIETLPLGYDTLVGDKGVQLSGGERQRLAIARALLKNPKILILDEATSALDSENERLVQHALEGLMKGRTTLIIAHRLSTVQRADQVLVLSGGTLLQAGTHQELMQTAGLYRTLVEHQLLG